MTPGTPHTKTILVVEDNHLVREGLRFVLRRYGYRLATAEDGGQALERLRSGARTDLILLGMRMPGMDGWQFLEELERLVVPKPVPILISTGAAVTREWALGHGAAGFLKKPFDEEDLLAEARRCWLDNGSRAASAG